MMVTSYKTRPFYADEVPKDDKGAGDRVSLKGLRLIRGERAGTAGVGARLVSCRTNQQGHQDTRHLCLYVSPGHPPGSSDRVPCWSLQAPSCCYSTVLSLLLVQAQYSYRTLLRYSTVLQPQYCTTVQYCSHHLLTAPRRDHHRQATRATKRRPAHSTGVGRTASPTED